MFRLTPLPSRRRLCLNHLNGEHSFQECCTFRPAPLRGRSPFDGKKVLLLDRCQATREARAAILRNHSVEVDEAAEISAAQFLCHSNVYDLVMLDFRRYSPEEALKFYEQIRDAKPGQPFVFLLGPPRYLSRTWPDEAAGDDPSRGQWGETVKRFLAAA
jgi:hypothetical protein